MLEPTLPRAKPLSKTASKLLVIGAILALVLVALTAALMIQDHQANPELQQRLEEIRQQEGAG